MGSPLSPILADIIMDDLENNCLADLDFGIRSFFRYVDDIFLITPKNKVDLILRTFNGYHPRLRFTHELENNNSISFLNTSVIRLGDGRLITNWSGSPRTPVDVLILSHVIPYSINLIL